MNRPALLLAAGLATRLGALREEHAKACLPVRGTTPLADLLNGVHEAGITRAWVNLHWRAEEVMATARAGTPQGLEIEFLHEPELLGTGGTLLEVTRREGVLPALVANAKFLTDFSFDALHFERPAMVVHPSSSLQVFGGLEWDEEGRVVGIRASGEARKLDETAAVYTGICVPDPAWLSHLEVAHDSGRLPCLIRDGLFPALKTGPGPLALVHSGEWLELSTPDRLSLANGGA